jgi:UDP-N-acetylglucosamine 2-epimerase (non-hydrolysing)
VAGARPNFMKVAPLWSAFQGFDGFKVTLVHTGQHYDRLMSDVFFADLGLPEPGAALGVGSGTHAQQTAATMVAFEELCQRVPFDLVAVVGDVNSTLACALVGRKLGIPVAHVEAGLRSGDWAMPEETNRVLTDVISDYLFTPSSDADENLRREGAAEERIHRVGNVMIDSLVQAMALAREDSLPKGLVRPSQYGLVTIHRPSNVDSPDRLVQILKTLDGLGIPLIFPVHPRTQKQIFSLADELPGSLSGLVTIEPVGYYGFVQLMRGAAFVLTDSGGVQEETTYLGVPCLTLRSQTERPITISQGTNELATLESVPIQVERVLAGKWKSGSIPELWDGKAATRTVEILSQGIHRLLV